MAKIGVKIRPWTVEDIPAIVDCHRRAYPDYDYSGGHYDGRAFRLQFEAFREGQFLAEAHGEVVGYATAIIVQLDPLTATYDYTEITGAGTFSTHNPSGDTLYGADMAVRPDFRGQGVSQLLYQQRRKLMRRLNLRRMLAFGRIPGYMAAAGKLTAQQYVDEVVAHKRKDPALSAHLRAGYGVLGVRLDSFRDPSSLNYSTLLEMLNPDFDAAKRRIAAPPILRSLRRARVCAAQYRFRSVENWRGFERSVEFFAETANAYHCHFLLMPELFTVQLMTTFAPELAPRDAILRLCELHEEYLQLFARLASQHQLYIIGGSTPVRRGEGVFNTAHLFTPGGKVYTQDKLHMTPMERDLWGLEPGDGLKVFDTPFGRIALVVCYDLEFPELSRVLTFAGAEVLFVPFSTDDRQAYYRVRHSAHARAVENQVFVVLSGNCGNLHVSTNHINYARSAVVTPSDSGFPEAGVAAEADPNVETVAIADLDLANLGQVRQYGSVRPLFERRADLYELRARAPVQVVRTE